MRVVLLCSNFPAARRPVGLPSYAALAAELARRGHDVVAVAKRESERPAGEAHGSLQIHRTLRGTAADSAGSWRHVAHDCRALSRALRGGDAALLVADATDLSPALLAVDGARARRVDLSFDWAVRAFAATHPWWSLSRDLRGLPRVAALAAGAALEPPDFTSTSFLTWDDARWKELLLRGLPVQSARVLVPGVDTRVFRSTERAAPVSPCTLLYHGPLTRSGGLNAVFLGLQRLDLDARLRIVAESREPAYLAELAELGRAAGVTDRVEVVPAGGEAQRARLLGAADVFVHPFERVDEFPRAALEAMAAGVPVVAGRSPGADRWFRFDETVLGFAPGDPGDLASTVRTVMTDRDRALRIAAAARRDVETRFGDTFTVDQLEPLLLA